MMPTRFDNLLDLARLPWFEVKDGRLVLADPTLPAAVDVHTHLALSYATGRVDLGREYPRTEHYLPDERALDLDVYINQNFTAEDLKTLEHDLTLLSVTARGMRRTHTVPNLRRQMQELGISQSVLLPIDFPVLSHNAERWLDATRGQDDFICLGSVHPYAWNMERRLDMLVRKGARGIKVHPAVQLVGPDNPRALRLYKMCGARKLPVLFHCGPVGIEPAAGRRRSQVARYEQALAENPDTIFILGHSGALQMPEALAFSLKYRNVYLECSSQGLPNVRRLCNEAPPDRLLFGTDWPFYHQAVGLAKVYLATDDNEPVRQALLHQNARRLFNLRAS